MPFSVAMNQPYFAPDDEGGMGQWEEIANSIAQIVSSGAQVATSYIKARVAPQVAPQVISRPPAYTGAVSTTAPQVTQITQSPYFLPLVGGLGLVFVMMLMGKK